MPELTDDFAYVLDLLGRPAGGPAPSGVDIAGYRGRLPDALLDFWQEAGFGLCLNGFYQVCHPDRFRPLTDRIFEGDPDFDAGRCHVIGMSAFGTVTVWHEAHRSVVVNGWTHDVRARSFLEPATGASPSKSAATSYVFADAEANDQPDAKGELMFERARRRLGPPGYGEIYVPVEHPLSGGVRDPRNIVIGDAVESLLATADLAPFALKDASILPPEVVRRIGRP